MVPAGLFQKATTLSSRFLTEQTLPWCWIMQTLMAKSTVADQLRRLYCSMKVFAKSKANILYGNIPSTHVLSCWWLELLPASHWKQGAVLVYYDLHFYILHRTVLWGAGRLLNREHQPWSWWSHKHGRMSVYHLCKDRNTKIVWSVLIIRTAHASIRITFKDWMAQE